MKTAQQRISTSQKDHLLKIAKEVKLRVVHCECIGQNLWWVVTEGSGVKMRIANNLFWERAVPQSIKNKILAEYHS